MNTPLTRTIWCKRAVDGHDAVLAATQRAFNAAAAWIARVCWDEGIAHTTTAHHRVYGETRLAYGLGAPLAVCARMKAREAIKAVKAKRRETCPRFGPRARMRSDARTGRLLSLDRVALNTLEGRVVGRLSLGARQHARLGDLAWEIGGADLVGRKGTSYLPVTQSREAPPEAGPDGGVLGVDLGSVNLAPDSAGAHFTGALIPTVRHRYPLRRQRLQKVGTRNAKRRIRRMGRRAARFQSHPTHVISKALVHKAVVARKARALEDLSGIRQRTPVRRANRDERHSWAFFPLRQDLTSKAAWAGVPVYLVDPKNTSRTCPRGGYGSKANRKSRAGFACTNPNVACASTRPADHVGAINVQARAAAQWAAVNRPMASPLVG